MRASTLCRFLPIVKLLFFSLGRSTRPGTNGFATSFIWTSLRHSSMLVLLEFTVSLVLLKHGITVHLTRQQSRKIKHRVVTVAVYINRESDEVSLSLDTENLTYKMISHIRIIHSEKCKNMRFVYQIQVSFFYYVSL